MRAMTERTRIAGENRVERIRIFGRRLAEAREKQSRTRKNVADQIGIGFSTIHYYENGQACPSVLVAARLAKAYGVSLDELVKGL